MACQHEQRNVQGLIHQAMDGHWSATFATPDGRALRSVEFCPWCGGRLHGKAPEAVLEQPAQAHAKVRWS